MKQGCYTALITPFKNDGSLDYEGLDKLIDFQIKNKITGILAVGTTGESPTLHWKEHNEVIEITAKKTKNNCLCIAGTGSNNTEESINGSEHAVKAGVDALLLVDPYYNNPSSMSIRKEYIEPIAEKFPDVTIIPYVIPGRTGSKLYPEDLALAFQNYPNVSCVKEATGDIENMKRTRTVCGEDFKIFSGDDSLTFELMSNPEIKGSGIISVASNIIPAFMTEMAEELAAGKLDSARKILKDIEPFFQLVTIVTQEEYRFGTVESKFKNPLPIKTLFGILGLPGGGCRRPLGKMTQKGAQKVFETGKKVFKKSPHVLKPVADFFDIDIEQRLNSPDIYSDLIYKEV
ncbi:MAG: 4-hydroxy-tetrahydrodipicolinate synthase [Deltaproteobacteria bacterium]|nr:MAG: 4-hydroxy-tetrahydrodipicolinate synthase [Deltaproteobacteria bacterium]